MVKGRKRKRTPREKPVAAARKKTARKTVKAKTSKATKKPGPAVSTPKLTPAPSPDLAQPMTIRVEATIRAPLHRLWAALTSPDEVNRWFTKRCEFEARPNGRVLYWWSSEPANVPEYVNRSRFGTAAECRIESWSPPTSFTVNATTQWPGKAKFVLEPSVAGTHLVLEHSGWPKKDAWYRDHVDGWNKHVDFLKQYLELPEAEFDAYVAKRTARTAAAKTAPA